MIRAVLNTDTGPVIVLGVVEENLRRMREGQPLSVDLGELIKAASGPDHVPEGKLRLAVMYGHTHRAIVEEINRSSPEPLPPETLAAAEQLDARLRQEGLL